MKLCKSPIKTKLGCVRHLGSARPQSCNRLQKMSKCGKEIWQTWLHFMCLFFFSYSILKSSVVYYETNRCKQIDNRYCLATQVKNLLHHQSLNLFCSDIVTVLLDEPDAPVLVEVTRYTGELIYCKTFMREFLCLVQSGKDLSL